MPPMPVRALFETHPALWDAFPHVELAELPTPVEEVPAFAEAIGAGRLFVKRDDLSGRAYGGNKVRKLEFLLQAARERGAKEVMTFGYAGSNHCTATAVHAQNVGLRSISMLIPQIPTLYLRRNLLASHVTGAELNHYGSARSVRFFTPFKALQHRRWVGVTPYVIPPGGSSPLGTLGFVNAAFELRQQIDAGELPAPDAIYLAFSSMGSAAGLALGLQAAGLGARVIGIQVVSEADASKSAAASLARRTCALLKAADPEFPEVDHALPKLDVQTKFFGGDYAKFTPESVEAHAIFRNALQLDPELALDGTYSGKALAGLAAAGGTGALREKTVLFWNTFNSRPFWNEMDLPEYTALPKKFWRYFETDLQDAESGV